MSINPYILTEEEQELENALEANSFQSVSNVEEEKKLAQQYAKNTLKRKQLTIRPYGKDIEAIKKISHKI